MESALPKKKLLGAQVEDALMQYILQQPIAVGHKLPNEFELAQQFSVGRSTIREAVKALTSKGILEVRRGDGTYVKSHSARQGDPLDLTRLDDPVRTGREVCDLCLLLLPAWCADAALYANEAQRTQLTELCAAFGRPGTTTNEATAQRVAFCRWMAQASGNRVAERLAPLLAQALPTAADAQTEAAHAQAVCRAVLARDAVGARCATTAFLAQLRG